MTFISVSYHNNAMASDSDWDNFMKQFNTNNADKNTGNTNNYSVDQYNAPQSDLDDIDNFINDYMIENPPTVQEQGIPNNHFIADNNKDRRLSYDVYNNKYNALQNYQNNTHVIRSRPSTAEHYSNEFNNNNQILQNIYIPQENNVVINQIPKQGNIMVNNRPISCNKYRKYTIDVVNKPRPEIIINAKQNSIPVSIPKTGKDSSNTINININKVFPDQQIQDKKQEIKLNNEELVQLLSNASPYLNQIPTCNNNIKLNNNKTPTVNKPIQFPNNVRVKDYQLLKVVNNIPQNIINNIKPVVTKNVSHGTINYQKAMTRVPIDTNQKKVETNIVDNKQCIKRANTDVIQNQQCQFLFNRNNAIEIVQNNIPTYWEKGITQNEVDLFFNNIKDSNLFENTTLQIYSLLGNIAPAFGTPDHIRLLFDVIKYNRSNKNEKHIYNYDKPLALTCILLDYYFNNIDLFNTNKEQFKSEGIEHAKRELNYNNQDYSIALQNINNFQYYYIISKIVKGINLIGDFKNNRNSNTIELKQIPLSNDMSKDWLTSTFQLFNYAIQCSSNSQDRIQNTQFAKFNEYLQTKSHHRDINENIQFIPTLKDFVVENKEQFSNEKINSALEALYKEEGNNTACCGIMGSIVLYRIFPELQKVFSSNQFGTHDCIVDLVNKFYFSTNQSLFTQFTEQSQRLIDIASYDNGRRLFNNTDYLIMVTNGLTRQQVVNERKYISRYHEQTPNNLIENLELYELIGVQFCSDNNVNYITVSGNELNDAVDSNSSFGKMCISKNLKPMQALYKLISQEDYNRYMKKDK